MHLESGQVAVVTGAASGLGLALAESFASRGLSLVLADVERQALAEAVAGFEARDVSVIGVPTDVRFSAQLENLATATMNQYGRVDVVCNNAGVSTVGPPMWEVPDEDWRWVLSVNLGGVINGIRAFVLYLVGRDSGHVVNTASMAGISVAPRQGPYVASKHAVVALSESLAEELALAAPNVGVTVVCPGIVATRILLSERNRPGELQGPKYDMSEDELNRLIAWASTISGPEMAAGEAAELVVQAIEANRLHVAPNGSMQGARAWIDRMLSDLEQ